MESVGRADRLVTCTAVGEVPGAKATPRKAVFAPAVANVAGAPVIVALYPLASTSLLRVEVLVA